MSKLYLKVRDPFEKAAREQVGGPGIAIHAVATARINNLSPDELLLAISNALERTEVGA